MSSSDDFLELDHNISFDEDDNFQQANFAEEWNQACEDASENNEPTLWISGPKKIKTTVPLECQKESKGSSNENVQAKQVAATAHCSTSNEQEKISSFSSKTRQHKYCQLKCKQQFFNF